LPSNPPEGPARRFARLTPAERRALRRAILLLPRVELGFRLRGYERTSRRIGGDLTAPPASEDVAELVAANVRAVGSAATRLPVPGACLARSVTLWALLRRQGIDSEVVIAVRRADGAPDAHAWVEREGVPLNELPEVVATYARLDRGRPG
jgi:hypothetical protein